MMLVFITVAARRSVPTDLDFQAGMHKNPGRQLLQERIAFPFRKIKREKERTLELWIHVDLKCLAPTPAALMRQISGWAAEGATGIVFEWENMFPYAGFAAAVRKDAYTPKQVAAILDHCRALGLKAIPLVQTLGHVEWCLSHPLYVGLREFEDTPGQIRACDERSYRVLKSWIADLLAAHHDSPYVHLGADEAWRLKEIDRPECSSRKEGASAVFLRHMKPLFRQVIEAGKRPIIWADMVLSHPECLDEFPRELVFCDWLYNQTSDYAPSVHGWGMPPVTAENYLSVPDEKKKHFEQYWRGESSDFPARFYQFPYLPFLRDRGFDVIGSPATICMGYSLAGPRLVEVRANERGWLNAAHRFGGLGVLNTCWAVRGALRETTLAGHRAFLIQGKAAPSIPPDSAVAAESWRAAAGDEAEQTASAIDRLAPPADIFANTEPLLFDVQARTHRPKPYDARLQTLMEELPKLHDDDPEVLERLGAVERAARAEAVLGHVASDSEEMLAWRLGAAEVGIRADFWLGARERALGRAVPHPDRLGRRIRSQADAVAAFMKNRYLPAELAMVRKDRYNGLLRLLDILSRPTA